MCYKKVGAGCEAVIVSTNDRMELVNLRLTVNIDRDPAGGSLSRAREYCLERLQEWLRN